MCVSVQVLHHDIWKQTKHFNYSICGYGLVEQKREKKLFFLSFSVLQNVFDAVSLVASVKQEACVLPLCRLFIRTFGFASYLSPQYMFLRRKTMNSVQSIHCPQKTYTCAKIAVKKKRQRGGWLIANKLIFWSSKAVVGLSDNFG